MSAPKSTPRTKFRTMSIGGATYDLFVRIPHEKIHGDEKSPFFTLPLGEKIRVTDVIETCGGGASNTSVGLARLGCSASISSVIGADQWGDKLLQNFRNEDVDVQSLTIVENEMTSFSIILSGSGGCRLDHPQSHSGTGVHHRRRPHRYSREEECSSHVESRRLPD